MLQINPKLFIEILFNILVGKDLMQYDIINHSKRVDVYTIIYYYSLY